jgi:hypothetical protein
MLWCGDLFPVISLVVMTVGAMGTVIKEPPLATRAYSKCDTHLRLKRGCHQSTCKPLPANVCEASPL